MKIGLVGPSYQELSSPFDAQRTINMYPVIDQMGKEVSSLRGVPGLELFATAGAGLGRKTFTSANGRAFVVSGADVYEVFADGTTTSRGSLLIAAGNVTIDENPTQMAICDGKNLYMFTYATNTLARVTDADLPEVGTVTFMDGYFICNDISAGGSGRFYISALNDGASWAGLDFATAESAPDYLDRPIRAIGNLWLLGTTTSEIWINTGNADFPFRRRTGSSFDIGVLSPYTALEVNQALVWLGRSKLGRGVVYQARGTVPQRISTPPIEQIIQRASNPEDCNAYTYHADGHWFYVLTGGGLPTTLVYDLTTQQWHERAQLTSFGVYEQHIVQDLMFAFDLHLGIDRRNGKIYKMDQEIYDNAGEVRSCERIFTHLSEEDIRLPYNRLVVGVEAGVGLQSGQGQDPQLMMRLSKDGAKTWSSWFTTDIGKVGKYKNKAVFRRLGIAEQMTFNVRVTDPVKVNITGAYLS